MSWLKNLGNDTSTAVSNWLEREFPDEDQRADKAKGMYGDKAYNRAQQIANTKKKKSTVATTGAQPSSDDWGEPYVDPRKNWEKASDDDFFKIANLPAGFYGRLRDPEFRADVEKYEKAVRDGDLSPTGERARLMKKHPVLKMMTQKDSSITGNEIDTYVDPKFLKAVQVANRNEKLIPQGEQASQATEKPEPRYREANRIGDTIMRFNDKSGKVERMTLGRSGWERSGKPLTDLRIQDPEAEVADAGEIQPAANNSTVASLGVQQEPDNRIASDALERPRNPNASPDVSKYEVDDQALLTQRFGRNASPGNTILPKKASDVGLGEPNVHYDNAKSAMDKAQQGVVDYRNKSQYSPNRSTYSALMQPKFNSQSPLYSDPLTVQNLKKPEKKDIKQQTISAGPKTIASTSSANLPNAARKVRKSNITSDQPDELSLDGITSAKNNIVKQRDKVSDMKSLTKLNDPIKIK